MSHISYIMLLDMPGWFEPYLQHKLSLFLIISLISLYLTLTWSYFSVDEYSDTSFIFLSYCFWLVSNYKLQIPKGKKYLNSTVIPQQNIDKAINSMDSHVMWAMV